MHQTVHSVYCHTSDCYIWQMTKEPWLDILLWDSSTSIKWKYVVVTHEKSYQLWCSSGINVHSIVHLHSAVLHQHIQKNQLECHITFKFHIFPIQVSIQLKTSCSVKKRMNYCFIICHFSCYLPIIWSVIYSAANPVITCCVPSPFSYIWPSSRWKLLFNIRYIYPD